jgi:hypothetical protein
MNQFLAMFDNVSNTEGVSYQVFIQTLAALLAIFVTVIFGIIVMINTRFTGVEATLKEVVDKLNTMSNTTTLNDYATKRDFKAIKEHFNITTPDTLPDTDEVITDGETPDT